VIGMLLLQLLLSSLVQSAVTADSTLMADADKSETAVLADADENIADSLPADLNMTATAFPIVDQNATISPRNGQNAEILPQAAAGQIGETLPSNGQTSLRTTTVGQEAKSSTASGQKVETSPTSGQMAETSTKQEARAWPYSSWSGGLAASCDSKAEQLGLSCSCYLPRVDCRELGLDKLPALDIPDLATEVTTVKLLLMKLFCLIEAFAG